MSNSRPSRTVGILGGMGPAATVDFMARLLAATPAGDDADHLHLIVDSNPKVPSRIAALIEGTGEDPLPELLRMARRLERAGAELLAMPCNTAHHYHDRIRDAVSIPFPSIVDVTANHIRRELPHARRIGFLASPAVMLAGVYHARFERSGLAVVYPQPEDNARLLGIIRDVKAGRTGPEQDEALRQAAARLAGSADLLLVACSELSVLRLPQGCGVPVLDTIDLLVAATIAAATAIEAVAAVQI